MMQTQNSNWLRAHETNHYRKLVLPHNWTPRWYQRRLFGVLESGKNAVCVWHRRAGKDVAMINFAAMQGFHRVGTYWHVFPTQKQARKAIWEGITTSGQRIIDQAFPKEIVKRKREDDMMIELVNGSIWRLVGGDNYDSLVGSNVAGCVFSEYAITDPAAYTYVRPILAESGGWVAFISTPRGKNHYHALYEMARKNPKWYAEILTVEQTGAIPLSVIEEERASDMPEEKIQQEYYCSFDAANYGAIYAKELAVAKNMGRVASVPYDARYPVHTCWDIGLRDTTAIHFIQEVGREVRIIDSYANRNKKLGHYLDVVLSKGYTYARHIGPHDMDREGFASDSIKTIAANHGVNFIIAPKISVEDGIEATRSLFSRLWIDEVRGEYLVKALDQYHYEWDDELKVLSNKPKHDWSSDPCDALRMYAVTPEGYGMVPDWAKSPAWMAQQSAQQTYDPLSAFRN